MPTSDIVTLPVGVDYVKFERSSIPLVARDTARLFVHENVESSNVNALLMPLRCVTCHASKMFWVHSLGKFPERRCTRDMLADRQTQTEK